MKRVLMDEFHLTVLAPRKLSEPEYEAIRQAIAGPAFRAGLARAARRVARRHPALSKVRLKLSR